MLPDNLTQLIMVLLAPATAGAVVSWLAERWPRFQALSSGWKVVMIAVIAFLFGGVAAVLKLIVEGSPQTTVELLNLLWLGGMTAVMALLGSQMWHEKYNKVRGELEKLPDLLKRAGASQDLVTLSRFLVALAQAIDGLQTEAGGVMPPEEMESIPPVEKENAQAF